MLFNILLAIVISSISLVILIQTKNLSKKYNFFDNPASEAKKIHKYPISNIGGLSCLIPFIISLIASLYRLRVHVLSTGYCKLYHTPPKIKSHKMRS